jgi:tetratricopeptide (TPR) repeat protein
LEAAIALHPTLGEAHFQLAKVLMHVGASEEALTPLRSAIDTDRNYALRAGSDGDFQAHQDKVDGLLYSLREEAKQIAQASLISVNHKYDATEKICVGPFSLPKYTDLEPVKGTIEKAIHEADSNAYFGYLNAEQECRRASELISQSVLHFAAGAKKDCNVQLTDIAHRIDACHIDTSLGVQMSTWSVMIIGFVVSWSAGTRGCTHYPYPWTGFGQWIGTMFVGLLLSGGCAFGLGLLIKTYAERETRRDRAKLRLEEEEKFRHFAEELDRHERAES